MTWWKWLLIGAVVGCLAGWYLRTPVVRVEERVVTQTVTKWRTSERIVTQPGATVYLTPDGGTMITGPVTIGRESEGSTSAMTDSSRKESKCPEPPSSVFAGGVQVGLGGEASYGGTALWNAVGPIWIGCGAYFPPARVHVVVGMGF
jgi:hypothetical protein